MNDSVGERFGVLLQDRRRHVKLSVPELAQRVGATPAQVEAWEGGQVDDEAISLARLEELAAALFTTPADLVPNPLSDLNHGVRVQAADDGHVEPGVRSGRTYYVYRDLVRTRTCPTFVPLVVDVLVGDKADAEFNEGHDGHEFLYVLEGTIHAMWGERSAPEEADLARGDSMYIAPWIPHTFTAAAPDKARLLAVNF